MHVVRGSMYVRVSVLGVCMLGGQCILGGQCGRVQFMLGSLC